MTNSTDLKASVKPSSENTLNRLALATMEIKNWLATVSRDATVNAIAREARVPQKTLDTQLRSATGLKPDMVVKIARAYRYPAVQALVDLGFLEASEALDAAGAEAINVAEALRLASPAQLAHEISERLARLEGGDEGGAPAEPTDPKPNTSPGANLPTLAEKRKKRTYPQPVKRAARPKPGKPKMGE